MRHPLWHVSTIRIVRGVRLRRLKSLRKLADLWVQNLHSRLKLLFLLSPCNPSQLHNRIPISRDCMTWTVEATPRESRTPQEVFLLFQLARRSMKLLPVTNQIRTPSFHSGEILSLNRTRKLSSISAKLSETLKMTSACSIGQIQQRAHWSFSTWKCLYWMLNTFAKLCFHTNWELSRKIHKASFSSSLRWLSFTSMAGPIGTFPPRESRDRAWLSLCWSLWSSM